MFSKLNTEIKKQSIKEKSEVLFSNDKERKLFEQKLIFGDLLENLVSLDIEAGYKVLSEEEVAGMSDAALSPELVQQRQEEENAKEAEEKMAKLDAEIAKLKMEQEEKKAVLKTDTLSDTQETQNKIDSLEQEKASLQQEKK
jgi:septal ring factor EnvC (AmiA/AmiB activator)